MGVGRYERGRVKDGGSVVSPLSSFSLSLPPPLFPSPLLLSLYIYFIFFLLYIAFYVICSLAPAAIAHFDQGTVNANLDN